MSSKLNTFKNKPRLRPVVVRLTAQGSLELLE